MRGVAWRFVAWRGVGVASRWSRLASLVASRRVASRRVASASSLVGVVVVVVASAFVVAQAAASSRRRRVASWRRAWFGVGRRQRGVASSRCVVAWCVAFRRWSGRRCVRGVASCVVVAWLVVASWRRMVAWRGVASSSRRGLVASSRRVAWRRRSVAGGSWWLRWS
ncbi:hypothetical protein ACXZ9C_11915, partial [Streptococcus agalactiae]